MNKHKDLKPCPFCGGERIKKAKAPLLKTIMFVCYDCGADVCFYGAEYEPEATERWNKRASIVKDVKHDSHCLTDTYTVEDLK